MKKEFTVHGSQKTVQGCITVNMNYTNKKIETHNPITHDTGVSIRKIHRITASIDNSMWMENLEVLTEENMLKEIISYEKQLLKEITRRSDLKTEDSFTSKIQKMGFK